MPSDAPGSIVYVKDQFADTREIVKAIFVVAESGYTHKWEVVRILAETLQKMNNPLFQVTPDAQS